ncbi:MAG: PTS system mannose/fructose/sorbose family transporter subunit IID [Desulfuromonadaceae bacterium]
MNRACERHLVYFNTHPFLASPILGTTLRLEEERSLQTPEIMDAAEFKAMIMAPYAAMGDAFFWSGMRPLTAAIALFFAIIGQWWAPLLFLLLFNIPHLFCRVAGLYGGYVLGLDVNTRIQRLRLPDLAIRCKEGTVILLGGLSAFLVVQCLHGEGLWCGWGMATIPVIVILGWLGRIGVSNLMILLCLAAVVLLFSR